jgi:hypothetical protein
MTKQIADIKKKILPILKRRRVKEAAIFGSTARGEANKRSDVDILVKFKGKVTLFGLGGLKADLEEKLKKDVDVVTFKSIDPRLKKSIMADMVRIL